jgi:Xaa-Pro aminopeptidase
MADRPLPRIPDDAFVARRKRLAERLGEGNAMVVATHAEALHSHDVFHRFRPQNDFWYLTGFNEPGSVLVLIGGSGESHLFLEERDAKKEIWTGRRLGVERAKDELEVDHTYAIGELKTKIEDITKGRTVHLIADHDPVAAKRIKKAVGDVEAGAPIVAAARCIKDAAEIAMMQKAADVAIDGHLAALPLMKVGRNEREAESAFLHAIRMAGSEGPGYPPIVGTGANAAVLHYIENEATIAKGDMVLMDAGAEWGYYNSDITRTAPASGEWQSQDKELYAIVLAAQDAAIAEARPGNPFHAPHNAAVRVLADGLADLGWIAPSDDIKSAHEAVSPFYMHGTSHFLGLDVHDAGAYRDDEGKGRLLEPGMSLTVEPGIYFNPDYAPMPVGVASKGIRIENDLMVTDDGCLDLTRGLTRDADELAALVAGN